MYNLIVADLFKLRKSMAIKILLAITTLSALVMVWIAYLIPQGKMDGSMIGMGFMFSDMNVISILGAVIAGVFICGDFDNKTIHDAIATGHSRWTVVISKATASCCAMVIILLPYAIITGIALSTGSEFSMGSVSLGFLNVLTSEGSISFSTAELGRLLGVMLTLIIVYVAQLSITVPLAFMLKKPVLVIVIYYGFSIFCGQLAGVGNHFPLLDRIFTSTPYGANYTLVTLDTSTGDILQAISVSLIFIVVMLVVAFSVFRRSEIK